MELDLQLFGGRGANSSVSKWGRLTKMFPNSVVTNGINQVQLIGREQAQKVWDMMEPSDWSQRKDARNTTLKELNEAPIVLTTFSGNNIYMNVYKNRKDLFNSVMKEYGGFNQITGGDRNVRTSISSLVGNGEFYLERDRFAKGGWKWLDGSGSYVEGYEKQARQVGSRRRNR